MWVELGGSVLGFWFVVCCLWVEDLNLMMGLWMCMSDDFDDVVV